MRRKMLKQIGPMRIDVFVQIGPIRKELQLA